MYSYEAYDTSPSDPERVVRATYQLPDTVVDTETVSEYYVAHVKRDWKLVQSEPEWMWDMSSQPREFWYIRDGKRVYQSNMPIDANNIKPDELILDYELPLWGPVLMVPDVFIAHVGYLTEAMRRGRFVRNWPLMVLDRFKYGKRLLGLFLWLRDLAQQVRYAMDQHGGQVPAFAIPWAEEAVRIYEEYFAASAEPYSGDAAQYGSIAAQVLGRGMDVSVTIQARKPEVSGDEMVTVAMQGRVTDPKQLVKFIEGQTGQFDRWFGQYL